MSMCCFLRGTVAADHLVTKTRSERVLRRAAQGWDRQPDLPETSPFD